MTEAEKGQWIRGLQPNERRWGFIASGYGTLVFLYVQLQYLLGNPYVWEKVTTAKGHTKYGWVNQTTTSELLLGVGLALMAGAALTSYFKKRAPLSFLLFLGGFATLSLAGLPLLIVGGWLWVRSWRVQRYGTPDAKVAARVAAEQREQRHRDGGGGGGFVKSLFGGGRKSASQSTAAKKTKTPAAAATRSAPEASKRYTPKKKKEGSSRVNRYSTAGRSSKS